MPYFYNRCSLAHNEPICVLLRCGVFEPQEKNISLKTKHNLRENIYLKDSWPGVSMISIPGVLMLSLSNWKSYQRVIISLNIYEFQLQINWNLYLYSSEELLRKSVLMFIFNILTFFTILVCSLIASSGTLVAPICWVIPPASLSWTWVWRS